MLIYTRYANSSQEAAAARCSLGVTETSKTCRRKRKEGENENSMTNKYVAKEATRGRGRGTRAAGCGRRGEGPREGGCHISERVISAFISFFGDNPREPHICFDAARLAPRSTSEAPLYGDVRAIYCHCSRIHYPARDAPSTLRHNTPVKRLVRFNTRNLGNWPVLPGRLVGEARDVCLVCEPGPSRVVSVSVSSRRRVAERSPPFSGINSVADD
ncbi:unnamed protein product [Danaus chrysippus]|uniref:(African queen) hypothetical protein n=1 Tax=Danaus chrysippus TaxID=151541 RepID=A0A8J2QEA6_9NEOP|nr:unnamed protein product [Danaus chrysippus]